MGVFIPLLIILLILCFAVIVLLIISSWKIYEKAGQAGWKCLIPYYGVIVMLEFCRKPITWIFAWVQYPIFYVLYYTNPDNIFIKTLFWTSFAICIIFNVIINYPLAKAFGKGVGFFIGLVFLPIIFYPILAFGDAEYQYRTNQCPDPEPSEIE